MSDDEDVFDEDLVRELGLDPEDLNGPKTKKAPSPQALMQPEAPARPARRPRPGLAQKTAAPEFSEDDDPEQLVSEPARAPLRRSQQPAIDPNEMAEEQALRVSKDIPVQLAAVLAKKSVKLQNILELKPGEVINFKKQPSDLFDLVANGRLIAKAELVMVDGQVGARIVKLIK